MKKIVLLCLAASGCISLIAQNVGIGTTTPAGKVHIKGAADASQLIIDANATQTNTNPLFKLRKGDGTDLMWIHSDHPFNTFIGLNSGSVNNSVGGGTSNTFMGRDAGNNNTTGAANTAIGSFALKLNVSGVGNTANGAGALQNNTIGNYNTAIGASALSENTTASENVAVGLRALWLQSYSNGGNAWVTANTAVGFEALYANNPVSFETGNYNTAIGHTALRSNSFGGANTAIGANALLVNTVGNYNTAIGALALYNNTIGQANTAIGFNALVNNSTAHQNTAIGKDALISQSFNNGGNSWISDNTAVGFQALYRNEPTTTFNGIHNTAVGNFALHGNTIGYSNTAVGFEALRGSLTPSANNGDYNTATGYKSLNTNSTGNYNTAFGASTLRENQSGTNNTAIGEAAEDENISGNNNTAIGYHAGNLGTNQSNNTIVGATAYINNNASGSTAIGYGATTNTNNLVVLGFPPITATGGYTTWSNWSDGRFKKNITGNVKGLDFILRLRPVTYQMDVQGLYSFWETSPYGNNKMKTNEKSIAFINDAIQKKESVVATGFIAQEVEKAAIEAGYDFSGVIKPAHDKDHYRIAYAEFVVPLVKAMQEQQKMISDLQNEIKELKKLLQK